MRLEVRDPGQRPPLQLQFKLDADVKIRMYSGLRVSQCQQEVGSPGSQNHL